MDDGAIIRACVKSHITSIAGAESAMKKIAYIDHARNSTPIGVREDVHEIKEMMLRITTRNQELNLMRLKCDRLEQLLWVNERLMASL
jgi:hypothetical protein